MLQIPVHTVLPFSNKGDGFETIDRCSNNPLCGSDLCLITHFLAINAYFVSSWILKSGRNG